MPDALTILYTLACVFLGGLLKGVVGLGLPLVALPLLSLALPLKTAVAVLIIPIYVTNLAQSFQGGLFVPTMRRFWSTMLPLVIAITLASQALVLVPERILYGVLGTVLVIVTVSLRYQPQFRITPAQEAWVGPPAGMFAGMLGGFTGVFGPALMMYLAALRLKKQEFVVTVSLFFLIGNTGLTAGLVGFGGAGLYDFVLSAAATLPTYLGLWLGQHVHARLDERRFAATLYVVYLATGISFLVRAVG